jgi:molecular chaperone GrpE
MPDEDNQQATLEQLQADLDTTTNNWKRSAADFENYKKQKEKENRELVEFAREVAVVKLLPTLDALEQALKHLPSFSLPEGEGAPILIGTGAGVEFAKKYQNWQIGINGILAQMDKILGELGVEKIEAVGKKFDPHFHEAVKEIESEKEEGMVVDELQSGFILNGKVIRPSQVVISKKNLS